MMSRRPRRFLPLSEQVEQRLLMSGDIPPALKTPLGYQAVRPNTPALPFGATNDKVSFIDPSVKLVNPAHIIMGTQSFVGPFALLNATSGFIKVGSSSSIHDNAIILSDPNQVTPTTNVLIGDATTIGFGAVVVGPSVIGAYGKAAQPTSVGPNAQIVGATIEPGAIVGALARVGPGVTVPTGFRVLPGKNVTTNAEASDPALGKVVPVTPADIAGVSQILIDDVALAQGYATLYQGNKVTGLSPGVALSVSTVFNGDLTAVEGTSQEPGTANGVGFEPAAQGPKFLGARHGLTQALLFNFPARITGQVSFMARAQVVAHSLGLHNSIRGDEGQPITFASAPVTGASVSISSPIQGKLTIGQNLNVGDGAVILGGPLKKATDAVTIGDNVTIGSGAVISSSSIGSNSNIGARAYVAKSTLAPGTVVPPGTIIIGNVVVGMVES